MKILVYDTAAESGGAISILKMYYEKALLDKDNEWTFIVSKRGYLPDEKGINVIECSYPKKSWIHRLIFDKFKAKKVFKKCNPDIIYNLQNVLVKYKGCKQIIYMHQPIPFFDYKISILDFKIWLYKRVISKMIIKSIKKCDSVIVQTNWLKDAVIKKTRVDSNKITVSPITRYFETTRKYEKGNVQFFYPAAAIKYKDHITILKACKELKKDKYDFKTFFTISSKDNKLAKKLNKYAVKNDLNVIFLGKIDMDNVYDYYSKSILVFPSYIETFGLPLLEARTVGSPIIASDTPFANEILDGYKVNYFKVQDYLGLAGEMRKYLDNNNEKKREV